MGMVGSVFLEMVGENYLHEVTYVALFQRSARVRQTDGLVDRNRML